MARIGFKSHHWLDQENQPAGGVSFGPGYSISWQNGPLGGRAPYEKARKPNGAFVEDILAIVKDRIEFYQKSKFGCEENETAIAFIELALEKLDERTENREKRQVEGTHQV